MGIMLRRVPGQAKWKIFKDGDYFGDVFQNPDGTWTSIGSGSILGSSGPPAPTRRDAAKQLTGQAVTPVG